MTSAWSRYLPLCVLPFHVNSFDEDEEDEKTFQIPDDLDRTNTTETESSSEGSASETTVVRRVRFGEEDDCSVTAKIMGPLLPPASGMTRSEKRELWWRKSDVDKFIGEAVACAQECKLKDRAEAMKTTPPTPPPAVRLLGAFAMCQDGNEDGIRQYQSTLEDWSRSYPSRRGLERWIVRDLYHRRNQDKSSSSKGVLEVQKILSQTLSPEEKADYIGNVSCYLSKSSRLLAHEFGKADAVAAKEEALSPPSSPQPSYTHLSDAVTDPILSPPMRVSNKKNMPQRSSKRLSLPKSIQKTRRDSTTLPCPDRVFFEI